MYTMTRLLTIDPKPKLMWIQPLITVSRWKQMSDGLKWVNKGHSIRLALCFCQLWRADDILRGINMLLGEAARSKMFMYSFWKEVYSKKKEFAPREQILPFRVDHFAVGAMWAAKTKMTPELFHSYVTMAEHPASVYVSCFFKPVLSRLCTIEPKFAYT